MPFEIEIAFAAMVIGAPMLGLPQHDLFHRSLERRPGTVAVELLGDPIEPVERFPERESQTRTDLQDGEAVAHEFAERALRLIVRRMRLVDEPVEAAECRAERTRGSRIVDRDAVVAELDAGLDNHGDGAVEGRVKAERVERTA